MPGGRPKKERPYKPEDLALVYKYAEAGLTNEQIAYLLDVSVRTFYRWMAEYPEFCQALKEDKAFGDSRVEASLYQRALGYFLVEEYPSRDTEGNVTMIRTTKQLPPDTTACIFWLKNRKPEQWRNNPEGGSGDDDRNFTVIINGQKFESE